MKILEVKSKAFDEGAWIPGKYSARGEDLSPDFEIDGIDQNENLLQLL